MKGKNIKIVGCVVLEFVVVVGSVIITMGIMRTGGGLAMDTVNYDELEVDYDSNKNEMIETDNNNNFVNNNNEMIDEAAESVEQSKKEEELKREDTKISIKYLVSIYSYSYAFLGSTSNTNNTNTSTSSGLVDRKTTCPFMVKMYCRINGHHRLEEFNPPRFPIEDEIIVYTWKDANLHELSLLVREVLGDSDLPGGVKSTDPNLKFSFQLLFPDSSKQSKFTTRPMGWAFEGGEPEARAHQLVDSSGRTLDSFRFIPGDFIDVAIYTNPAMIPKTHGGSSSSFSRPHHMHNQGNHYGGNRRVYAGGSTRF